MSKYSHINFKPTESMAKAAKRGLDMRDKQPDSNKGMTSVGLTRARQLIARETLSPETVKRMFSFFSRHEVDKSSSSWKEGNSKGEQAWLGWGGDAGFAWSRKIVKQMESADKANNSMQVNVIRKESDGYHVYSEKGKHLGGPYTKEEAEKRLRQIEYFKGKNNMKLNFNNTLIINAEKVSTQKIKGIDHIIVKDVCHMIGDSVMNDIFYPFEEMEKLCANLQGRRIIMPAEHPTDDDGSHMSASDPLSHIEYLVGAYAYNFSIRGDKLISDMAINPSQAFNNPKGEAIINAIQSNQDLDMSTGFFLEIEELTKEMIAPDGNPYKLVARNLQMDHSALLPISPGAKTSKEGVGIRANMAVGYDGSKMDLSVFVANDTAASMSLPIAGRETPFGETEAIARIKGFTKSDNMPTTNYRKFFAYYDRDNADNFDAYKFPFADIMDGKPMVNYIALIAAEKQILEADITEDEKDEARKVITHYKAMYDEQGQVGFNSKDMDEGTFKKAMNAFLGVFGLNAGYNTNEPDNGVAVHNATEDDSGMDYKKHMMDKLKKNGYIKENEDMDKMSDEEVMNRYDKMNGEMMKKQNMDDDKDNMDDKKKPDMKGNADLAALVANSVAEANKPLLAKIEQLETTQNSAVEARKSELVDLVVNSVPGMTKEIAGAMEVDALESLASANGHTNFDVGHTGMPVQVNADQSGFADLQMPDVKLDS